MGIKDKIKDTLRSVWSPITVWMAEEGSDHVSREAARVVAVNGEDDGTADRIELTLELVSGGVGVLDPEGKAGIRDRPSPSLLSWLASLDSSPGSN